MRWRTRAGWWRALYWLIVVTLQALNIVRFVAFGVAVLAHRAHAALAAYGEVTAETLSAHGEYASSTEPHPDRYQRLAEVVLIGRDDRGGRF